MKPGDIIARVVMIESSDRQCIGAIRCVARVLA